MFSAADPRHTLLDLVGAPELPPEFVWHTQSIKMRGSVAKVHLLTDGSHGLPTGTLVVAPTLKYLERAYDAAKYGEMSTAAVSRDHHGGPTSSRSISSSRRTRCAHGDWDRSARYCRAAAPSTRWPGISRRSRHRSARVASITPLDLEQTYGLTEGDLNHGQLILDQMFFMRPLPGWSNHRTPIDGLYLCGSGVHGGGGISGAAGRNAAHAYLKSGT